MTAQDRILRGQRAENLLANPILAEAFTAIEEDLTGDWKTSATKSPADREALFAELQVLRKVQGKVESFIHDGRIAATRPNIL